MKADKLNAYIKHYLVADRTKSAIMLTAGWGTGKSYYIQNELLQYLKENGEHQCIIVSLYGLTSIKDVSKSVYLETRTKKLQVKSEGAAAGVLAAKTVLRGVTSVLGVEVNANEDDLQRLYDSIDLSGKLIIFEDVERTQIDILEFLGYVNGLVEQDGVKVLLVTNEDELLKRDPPKPETDEKKKQVIPQLGEYTEKTQEYLRTKEKSVSDTIVYEPDYLQAIKAIIHSFEDEHLSRFEEDEYLEDIEGIFVLRNCPNLRTFTFACQKTVDIFEKLPDECSIDNRQTIFYSIIAFSSRIKNGEFPKWDGTKQLSVNLGLKDYPLYRFCYDYIRWQDFDDAKIAEAFEEHKNQMLYGQKSGRDDADLSIIGGFYTRTETEVLAALKRVEERLKDYQDLPFYCYGQLAVHLVQLKTVLGFDYTACKERMVANIRGRAKEIDGDLLFFIGEDPTDETEAEEYRTFRKEILDSLNATDDEIGGFSYTPEELSNYYVDIVHESSNIRTSREFISKYDVDKLMEMLVHCDASQLHDFRGILWAVYRHATKGSFIENDIETMQQLLAKILVKKENDELPTDRIVRHQFKFLIDNLNHFIEQLSGVTEAES